MITPYHLHELHYKNLSSVETWISNILLISSIKQAKIDQFGI